MNRYFNKKNLAFTLAEMMVVLAVFSVVSAATLPVMTARQQITTEVAGAEGSSEDPWVYKDGYDALYYYNSTQPSTSAVMVGGQVTDTPESIGYPQLIVNDSHSVGSGGSDDASQIVLFRRNNNTPYYAGRITLGNTSFATGSVQIGANAHAYNANTTSRQYNVAIGSNAMNSDGGSSTAYKGYSIAVGTNALRGDRQAAYTVAIGNNAGYASKFYNTVLIGNYAGYTNQYDSAVPGTYSSVFIGDRAGYSTLVPQAASNTVGIGTFSLLNNTMTSRTVAIGTYAGAKTSNGSSSCIVAIGSYAGFNTPQTGNTALGYYAGASSSIAGVAIGTYAGYGASGSYDYVAVGSYAGYNAKNITAIGTYAGYNALDYNSKHVFIGAYAGANVDNGGISGSSDSPSVVIGNHAGEEVTDLATGSVYIGNYAGYNTSVFNSVCIGYRACEGLGSPSKGEFIRIASKDGEWNDIDPDYNVSVIGDIPSDIKDGINTYAPLDSDGDTLVLTPLYSNKTATSTNSSIVLYGFVYGYTNSLTSFSDRRLKREIVPAKYGLKDIRKINVYNYNWKSDDTKTPRIGVIAQELQKVIPEGVQADKSGSDGYLTVNVEWLIYPMINAIKELDVQVQTIKKQVVAYAKEYVTLAERVNKLEKEVKVLEKENKALTRDVKVAYKKVKKAESLR